MASSLCLLAGEVVYLRYKLCKSTSSLKSIFSSYKCALVWNQPNTYNLEWPSSTRKQAVFMKILAVRSSKVAVVFRKVGGELLPQPGNTGTPFQSLPSKRPLPINRSPDFFFTSSVKQWFITTLLSSRPLAGHVFVQRCLVIAALFPPTSSGPQKTTEAIFFSQILA